MKTKSLLQCRIWILLIMAALLHGCAASTSLEGTAVRPDKEGASAARDSGEMQLPVRFQKPTYMLKELEATPKKVAGLETYLPVGVKFSSMAPLNLREVIKKLADLKGMTVSWASDVDQNKQVDVDIKEEDDFYNKIGDILRQHDYSFETQGETIIVKYRVTKKFHIAMPFTSSTYNSGVGGNVLGASGGTTGGLQGTIQLTSNNNSFDIWDNVRKNIDTVLEIWTDSTVVQASATSVPATPPPATSVLYQQRGAAATTQTGTPAAAPTATPTGAPTAAPTATPTGAPAAIASAPTGKGYYTIDKPIGLLTVTAPQSLLRKIEDYVTNLKSELYRQISIEAKIVEVELSDSTNVGIDWSNFFKDLSLNFTLLEGGLATPGELYPAGNKFVSTVSLSNARGGSIFSVIMNALKTQGNTNVLSNPKLSVINGQPALLSVGKNVRYIDSVTTTVSDSGTASTSVTTASVMSGIGMAVIATIMEKNEIILTITPVTSQLTEPIEVVSFGSGNIISLPEVKIREMNTIVRVKDGDMLVIGGLIDNKDANEDKKTPFLGDVPVLGKLFSTSNTGTTKKELVIFLMPRIIS